MVESMTTPKSISTGMMTRVINNLNDKIDYANTKAAIIMASGNEADLIRTLMGHSVVVHIGYELGPNASPEKLLDILNKDGVNQKAFVFLRFPSDLSGQWLAILSNYIRELEVKGWNNVGVIAKQTDAFQNLPGTSLRQLQVYRLWITDSKPNITDADGWSKDGINAEDMDGALETAYSQDKAAKGTPWWGMGYDTQRGGGRTMVYSPDGVNQYALWSTDGLNLDGYGGKIWNAVRGHTAGYVDKQVDAAQTLIKKAQDQADASYKQAEDAISKSKVNADNLANQQAAIKSVQQVFSDNIATIQNTIANAKADSDKIKADVAAAQKEIADNQKANADTAKQLQTDIAQAKSDLAAAKTANDAVAKQLQAAISQTQSQVTSAQQANADLQKSLQSYADQAAKQGQTIKSIQDTQSTQATTIADVQGDVTQLSQTATTINSGLTDAKKDIANLKATATSLTASLEDANKNITTVTATANGLTTDLADTKKNLASVQDQANQLSTTVSDANKNITQLTQTATSLTTKLSDVTGDVAAIKTTVAGIKATLTDHNGRISKLSASADKLTSALSDATGRISKVEQKANGLTEQFANFDAKSMQNRGNADVPDFNSLTSAGYYTVTNAARGKNLPASSNGTLEVSGNSQTYISDDGLVYHRAYDTSKKVWSSWSQGGTAAAINEVKRTADSNTQTIAGLNGTTNRLQQSLTATQSTLTNAQGDINRLKQTATDTSSKIISVTTDVAGLKDKAKTTDNNVAALQNKVTANTTEIDQNAKAIGLKANQSVVDNLSKTVANHTAELSVHADEIASKVDSATYQGLAKKVAGDENTIAGNVAAIAKNSTDIEQNSKSIALKADQTVVDNLTKTAKQQSSRLDVMAGKISSKVDSTTVNNIVNGKGFITATSVQSMINQKAGVINESITTLSNNVDEKNNVNLLTGTKDFSGNWAHKDKWQLEKDWKSPEGNTVYSYTQAWNGIFQPISVTAGWYTFSAWMEWKLAKDQRGFIYVLDTSNSYRAAIDTDNAFATGDTNGNWSQFIVYIHVTKAGYLALQPELGQNGGKVYVASMKLEHGKNPHPIWTPAPSDSATVTQLQSLTATVDGIQSTVRNKADQSTVTQLSNVVQSKVAASDFNVLKNQFDTQTLKSANIDQLTTTGHYFVENLTGSPFGGSWVFVDVRKGGPDGWMTQTVYQDTSSKQASRHMHGKAWTSWGISAEESEITQLKDMINLRVTKDGLISQINLSAGSKNGNDGLISIDNGKGKLNLNADSVNFSGTAFIPDAYIKNINASKLTFYGNNAVESFDTSLVPYDQDAQKNTIVTSYNGGIEIHSSQKATDTPFLSMHDGFGRFATARKVNLSKYPGWYRDGVATTQYTGLYVSKEHAVYNLVNEAGWTSGVTMRDKPDNKNSNDWYRVSVYDGHPNSVGLDYSTDPAGINIGSGSRTTIQAANIQMTMGWDKAYWDNQGVIGDAAIKNNSDLQKTMIIYSPSNVNQNNVYVGIAGWMTVAGWFNCMGMTQKSLLSAKQNVAKLDSKTALQKIMSTDVETYQYKAEMPLGKHRRHAGPVIDDVNDVAKYNTPDEFTSDDKQGVELGSEVGYLMAAMQEQQKEIESLKEELQNAK